MLSRLEGLSEVTAKPVILSSLANVILISGLANVILISSLPNVILSGAKNLGHEGETPRSAPSRH